MISISGSKDTGFEANVKMNAKSAALEIVIDYGGEEEDISDNDFALSINKTPFPIYLEDGILKINPSNINLATGIYPFTVCMNQRSILSGYFEWQGDDN